MACCLRNLRKIQLVSWLVGEVVVWIFVSYFSLVIPVLLGEFRIYIKSRNEATNEALDDQKEAYLEQKERWCGEEIWYCSVVFSWNRYSFGYGRKLGQLGYERTADLVTFSIQSIFWGPDNLKSGPLYRVSSTCKLLFDLSNVWWSSTENSSTCQLGSDGRPAPFERNIHKKGQSSFWKEDPIQ